MLVRRGQTFQAPATETVVVKTADAMAQMDFLSLEDAEEALQREAWPDGRTLTAMEWSALAAFIDGDQYCRVPADEAMTNLLSVYPEVEDLHNGETKYRKPLEVFKRACQKEKSQAPAPVPLDEALIESLHESDVRAYALRRIRELKSEILELRKVVQGGR